MHRKPIAILPALAVMAILLLVAGIEPTAGQIAASATPARVSIPSVTPLVTDAPLLTATPSQTPTPIGTVLLEAKEFANVRAAPDIEAEKLGTIRAGEMYAVIGRSFRWLQFQYDPSPSGTGWVYDELVNIIGNPEDIIDLNANTLPTIDTSILNATQTWEVVTQTPGGLLTATANARLIQPPPALANTGNLASQDTLDTSESVALPTFTFPPDVIAQAPTLRSGEGEVNSVVPNPADSAGGVAPIVPIIILGGLGLAGLVFSSARR